MLQLRHILYINKVAVMFLLLFISSIACMAQKSRIKAPLPDEALASTAIDTVAAKIDSATMITKADSLALGNVKKVKVKRDWTTWKPDPKRAMWLAIVLPGAGQIYNRKYWKLPIVYGGFLGCIYAMRWNNMMYNDYSQAYLDIMDDDPTTKSYTQFLHFGTQITSDRETYWKSVFKSRKDRYRRWRDLSFFCMLGVYAISIIDAYVDASLSQFDISNDLSLTVEPAVISGSTHTVNHSSTPDSQGLNSAALGVHGALKF